MQTSKYTPLSSAGIVIGAKATVMAAQMRDLLERIKTEDDGGFGGQAAILTATMTGIAIAVGAVMWSRAEGGATAIPTAPSPSTSFPGG